MSCIVNTAASVWWSSQATRALHGVTTPDVGIASEYGYWCAGFESRVLSRVCRFSGWHQLLSVQAKLFPTDVQTNQDN